MFLWNRLKAHLGGDPAPYLSDLVNQAQTRLLAQDWEGARPPFLKLLSYRNRINDETWINYFLTGLEATWIFQDRYQEQINYFNDYIRRYPNDAMAYQVRGSAHWYAVQLPEALADFDQALAMPHSQKTVDMASHSARGQVLVELGEHERALRDLDRAIEFAESLTDIDEAWRRDIQAFARNGRAAALAGRGDFDAAGEEFQRSLDLHPDNAWVYFNRAKAFEAQGRPDLALNDYRLALEKRNPRLSISKTEHAQRRIHDLKH